MDNKYLTEHFTRYLELMADEDTIQENVKANCEWAQICYEKYFKLPSKLTLTESNTSIKIFTLQLTGQPAQKKTGE